MIHASRTNQFEVKGLDGVEDEKSYEASEGLEALMLVSGERVSNTWVICLKVGNNCSKEQLIPHVIQQWMKGSSDSL